jgi:predicted dehydrogenase
VTGGSGAGLPVTIVGCGLIGEKRARALRGLARLVAVHDVEERRAAGLAASVAADAVVCTTANEAFERAEGGLVIVATTHAGLAPLAARAIELGCHVLVEKPGGRSIEEVVELARVARDHDRVVRVGFNHRFHPAIVAAHAALVDGRYGAPFLVRARYGHGGRTGYEQEWRADRVRSGGGELLDQGAHLIDLTRLFLGPLSLRYAALPTSYWPMDVEDNAFLHLRSAGGADAWLHASWTEWKNLFSFEISCRRAKLEISGLGGSYGPEQFITYELGEQLGPPKISTVQWPPDDQSWRFELLDVLSALDGGPSFGATIEDCLATLAIVSEAYQR